MTFCNLCSMIINGLFLLLGMMIRGEELQNTTHSTFYYLKQVRALQAPNASLVYGGEFEHGDWWQEHAVLFQQARREWGQKHPQLYTLNEFFQNHFLNPTLVQAMQTRDKTLFTSLVQSTNIHSVYTIPLFTTPFTTLLLEELQHHDDSGIPLRRPNGMNRFGAILDDLGFTQVMQDIVDQYLVPLAREIFPNAVGPEDLVEHYAFVNHYQPGQDESLSPHTDASVVTYNIPLLPDEANVLYFFKEPRSFAHGSTVEPQPSTYLEPVLPGQAVIHLGQHVHGVDRITSPRCQIVIWMYGEHGYVRIAPYTAHQVARHVQAYRQLWNKEASIKDEF